MQFLHLALAILVVVIWGFNFVVIQIGLQEIPPLLLCFSRFFLTSIPAIFFVKRPQIPFKMLLLYGLTMFVLPFSLLFIGMHAGL
ncbi:MAG: EamA family transporter, partial [Chlamydiota bacterium]